MQLVIEKPVTVITPSVGSPKLKDAIDSVANQTYACKHLIVCDGTEYFDKVFKLAVGGSIQFCVTPENTGKTGGNFYGHRIYAAYPHLINSDYILFLDEDNWYEPNHVETLVKTVEDKNLDFSYSLRKIFSPTKEYLCDDNCESLGYWESIFPPHHSFVDTNCYCFKRKYLMRHSHLFFGHHFYMDRLFYTEIVKVLPEYDCNGEHTVNYRVRGHHEKMHEGGNAKTLSAYQGNYPWTKNRSSL
mgnify:CR=1 FL=1